MRKGYAFPSSTPKTPGLCLRLVDLTNGNVDRSILKYTWYIDHGRMLTGQATPVITVDTTGQSPGSITATIDISPYPDCEWISSDTTRILPTRSVTEADQFWMVLNQP